MLQAKKPGSPGGEGTPCSGLTGEVSGRQQQQRCGAPVLGGCQGLVVLTQSEVPVGSFADCVWAAGSPCLSSLLAARRKNSDGGRQQEALSAQTQIQHGNVRCGREVQRQLDCSKVRREPGSQMRTRDLVKSP